MSENISVAFGIIIATMLRWVFAYRDEVHVIYNIIRRYLPLRRTKEKPLLRHPESHDRESSRSCDSVHVGASKFQIKY